MLQHPDIQGDGLGHQSHGFQTGSACEGSQRHCLKCHAQGEIWIFRLEQRHQEIKLASKSRILGDMYEILHEEEAGSSIGAIKLLVTSGIDASESEGDIRAPEPAQLAFSCGVMENVI